MPIRLTPLLLAVAFSAAAAEPYVATVAGTGVKGFSGDGGPADKAQLNNPFGVVRGPDAALYVCDTMNHVIRRIDGKTGIITTIAGTPMKKGYAGDGGPASKALMNEPYEVRFDRQSNMYVVERMNHVVRKVDKDGVISTLAGTGKPGFGGDGGPAVAAQFNQPHAIQIDPDDGDVVVCDTLNHRLRYIDSEKRTISTTVGTGEKKPVPVDGGSVFQTPLWGPRAIDFDKDGNLWLALREGNAVYLIDWRLGAIRHVAGTGKTGFTGNGGPAKEATLSGPKGLAIHPKTGDVYLADTESHSIRRIDVKTGRLELVAGTGRKGDGPDGNPLKCEFARPHGVFVDADGSVFVGDSENHRVRVIRLSPSPVNAR